MKFVRNIYDWVLAWAESKYGPLALFILAFAESLFYNTPVISTDVADIKEIIGERFIFPFNEPSSLSNKILEIKDNYIDVLEKYWHDNPVEFEKDYSAFVDEPLPDTANINSLKQKGYTNNHFESYLESIASDNGWLDEEEEDYYDEDRYEDR